MIFYFYLQAALCVLALSVNAQVGPSGIVNPNGQNIQFTSALADNIAVVGPSGIVTKDGRNIQLGADGVVDASVLARATPVATPKSAVPLPQLISTGALVGNSGIVNPDGNNVQFTQEQADNIVLAGPSGIVTRNGQNIQFRQKRSIGFVSPNGNVGTSGILRADGTTTLFDHDTAHNIVLIGPSGIVGKNGNMQFTSDLNIAHQSTHPVQPQFHAADVVLDGPSGTILADGTLIQKRAKRSAPLIGPSGMILADGTPVQFKSANAKIVLDGPSGMVLSDGTLVQKRAKRHTVGPSGIVTSNGQLIQLEPGVTVVSAGPSGFVLSNGKNVQLKV